MPPNNLLDSLESKEKIQSIQSDTLKIIRKENSITAEEYFSLFINCVILLTLIIKVIQPLTDIVKPLKVKLTKKYFKEIDFVEDLLEELLLLTKADRVCVGVFHNGQVWGHFHFMKMTIAYEACKHGISSIKKLYANVPIEKIKNQLQIVNVDEFSIFNRNDNLEPECVRYLDSQNLKGILSRLLTNKKGEVIAILEAQRLCGYFGKEDLSDSRLEPTFNRLMHNLSLINEGKELPIGK